MKRLIVELDDVDYAYVRGRAAREGRTVDSLLRDAVTLLRRKSAAADPMYQVGSFDGPANLAERHDGCLYGAR